MRLLALSIGNSNLLGATLQGERVIGPFRLPKEALESSATLEASLAPRLKGRYEGIVLASVVPRLTRPLCRWLEKNLGARPLILKADTQTMMKIAYKNPKKLGTDRLAAALGARALFPGKPLAIVDCGTATTVTLVSADGVLCGGAILPGIGLWAEALAAYTAQLPRVKPSKPASPIGRTPREAIRSGLYIGHLGAIEKLVRTLSLKAFGKKKPVVLGTGGASVIFAGEKLFTRREPNLVLEGLRAFAAGNFDHA